MNDDSWTAFFCGIFLASALWVMIILMGTSVEDTNRTLDCTKHTELSAELCEDIVKGQYSSLGR